jgi:hypothetical protein
MAVYDDVKKGLQEFLAPQLAEVRGELSQVRGEIAQVRADVSQLRAEMHQEINNLHTDLVRMEQVFDARFQSVSLLERVARLEERVGQR